MGRHESPVAILDRNEHSRLVLRALEQVAELDTLPGDPDPEAIWRWAGRVKYTLMEVARG